MLQCPVLLLTGGNSNTDIPPILNNDLLEKYHANLSNVSIEVLERSGHRLWEPDYNEYIGIIKTFLHVHN